MTHASERIFTLMNDAVKNSLPKQKLWLAYSTEDELHEEPVLSDFVIFSTEVEALRQAVNLGWHVMPLEAGVKFSEGLLK